MRLILSPYIIDEPILRFSDALPVETEKVIKEEVKPVAILNGKTYEIESIQLSLF